MSRKTKHHPVRYPAAKRGPAAELRETAQGVLLPLPAAEQPAPAEHNAAAKLNGGFADSAFADNKHRPIHRWVPWIAGFSSEFVRDAFNRYLPEDCAQRAVVLDPFCGVGTTLIEALRCGHDAVGFEINPYAALAARAKCEAATISVPQLAHNILRFEEYMRTPQTDGDLVPVPEHFHSRIPFFGPRAKEKVLKALRFIKGLRVLPIHDLFALAFGSVMVNLSNYSYEPSLSSRPAVGKPTQEDAPVAESIVTKLLAMKSDVAWFRGELERLPRRPAGRVMADNFLDARHRLDPGSIDLIVTSPPYLNNYHYVRNTRPQLFWLGFIRKPSELKRLETENFGKYWQTVRDLEKVPLSFRHAGLERLLAQIRAIGLDRGTYGGPGWANYAASYFNDTDRFCQVASQVLKRGGRAVVVVGNSILQGVEIGVDNILSDLAAPHGLTTESIHIVRQKRVGASIVSSSVRQGIRTSAKLYESAVVLRRS
ncbi:MAG: DNA methyltransferase [Verrucomicrobiota bacterium]